MRSNTVFITKFARCTKIYFSDYVSNTKKCGANVKLMLSQCAFNVKTFLNFIRRNKKITAMKSFLSIIFLFGLHAVLSAQAIQTLPSGERIQLLSYSDADNYSFARVDINGRIEESGNYKSGLKDGEWINYNSNGSISGKGNYVNGRKEGDWSFFTMEGAPAYLVSFHDGIRTGAIQLDERGNALAETKTKE
jgi:hypothetical protein